MLNKIKNFVPKEVESEVLKFWEDNKIFEKSVKKKAPKGDYVFFDGPPFATGLPHYGHIVASTMKDVVPRYWTMKGYKVERKWGWDCHGLPIENIAEKELQIKKKKEIEKMGIGKFNEFCRSKVLAYTDEWEKVIGRLGRWADMKDAYKTMDAAYMESVWWVFKELWDKGLVYEGYRSMHICTRCETTLSQQEVAEGYKDIKDLSAIAKFELTDSVILNAAKRSEKSHGNKEKFFGLPQDDKNVKTYILAWTTTPWTLIGNVALAVGANIKYVKVKIKIRNQNSGITEYFIILAKDKLADVLKNIQNESYEIVEEFKGKDLAGKEYKPLFDYYIGKGLQNEENGWKIYPADFVTTEDGTGIVHIAPAFGEDDLKLGQKYKLPFIQHVGMDGIIRREAGEFAGMSVKPADDHQKTDIEIIKWLAQNNKLFSKEKYEHSYPHCWRCDTPLINYATSSWFVDITKIKGRALELAKKINWVPEHIKEGRFGNWLEGARDWSISRQRFWASVIPIWRCGDCKKVKVIGSVNDIKKDIKTSGNNYFVMRHGQSESNLKGVVNSDIKHNHHRLTGKGKKEVAAAAKKLVKELKKEKIDVVFSSDFERARETAGIMAEILNVPKPKVIFDAAIREVNTGIFNGKKPKDYHGYFKSLEEKFYKTPPEGENLNDLKNRVTEFLYELEDKYKNKNILIISHEYPVWLLVSGAAGADVKKSLELRGNKEDFIKTGGYLKLDFKPIPHRNNYELDLHRPYIDEVEFICDHSDSSEQKCGGKMKRIPDVLDTWFDSGSMPYAQVHYPFENKKKFENNFPAEFIAEGVDQTRAWFYYLHSISTAIKNSNAYKNVVVNGIVLAEDGKKMSKRLNNYPDPMEVINKYGADALRLYLLSSPVMRAENLNFSEKGVDELYKKTILRLWNVYNFYNTYANRKIPNSKFQIPNSNILDKWILARLNQLIADITKSMDKYELDKSVKPISEFVDDLSTWYVRRSRRRLQKPENKKDYSAASATTGFVLSEFSKVTAPFIPFIAEALYHSVKFRIPNSKFHSSVHLESWPKADKKLIDEKLLQDMSKIRIWASLALAKRSELGIKVRQPLASLKIKDRKAIIKNKELLEILADEINVKEIIFDSGIKNEIELDANITPKLKEEGMLRDFVRVIQDLRQEAGLNPKDAINLYIGAPLELGLMLNSNAASLKKEIGAKNIEFKKSDKFDAELQTKFEGQEMWLGIKKI